MRSGYRDVNINVDERARLVEEAGSGQLTRKDRSMAANRSRPQAAEATGADALARVDALAGVAALNHAVAALAGGRMIVVVDDEQRENECDMVVAADALTVEQMAFMVR